MKYEALLRLSVFLSLFVVFAGLEAVVPKRKRVVGRAGRWFTNLSLTVLNTLALRALAVVLPFLAVGAAVDAWSMGWGLFNQVVWPLWVEVLLALLVLDFAIWAQHWLTHKVPLFWRFHRMHHADRDMDVTTALRFHPVEILASMGLKIGLIYLLGPQAVAVVLFEIILNGTALFNHANLRLPIWLDRIVRLLLVTPDMHRVHHSIHPGETNSNFGFNLPWWDRLFGTYQDGPRAGYDRMIVGLKSFRATAELRLDRLLTQPFRKSD